MRRIPALVAVLVTTLAVLPSGATAQGGGTGFKVTIAARECPEYTDITANRARNDIQESLRTWARTRPTAPVSRLTRRTRPPTSRTAPR